MDAVGVLRDVLVAAPTVDPVGGVVRRLAAAQTWPAVRLTELGGAGLDEQARRRDIATVRVEAWGDHDQSAVLRALVAACREAATDPGHAATASGRAARIRELSRPAWAPDPEDHRPRFTWTVELTLIRED